jgi:hypothetical protein
MLQANEVALGQLEATSVNCREVGVGHMGQDLRDRLLISTIHGIGQPEHAC